MPLLSSLNDIREWDKLSSEQKRQVALEVEQMLPRFGNVLSEDETELVMQQQSSDDESEPDRLEREALLGRYPVVFRKLGKFRAGDQEHEIAMFVVQDDDDNTNDDGTGASNSDTNDDKHSNNSTTVAAGQSEPSYLLLIPGGVEVELGYEYGMYDNHDTNFPSQQDRLEYQENYERALQWRPLPDFMADCMTSHSHTTLGPYLLDQKATESDYNSMGDGLDEAMKRAGWSLPTSDEWEWAYRGGTALAFPSGNEYDMDLTHNGFGMAPPESTYNVEMTEDGTLRGGDGGVCECGGYSGVAWLVLQACAFSPSSELDLCESTVYYRRCHRLSL